MNRKSILLTVAALAVLSMSLVVSAAPPMASPKTVTVSGTLIDLSCAAKAKTAMNSWRNVENDHVMPEGNVQKSCAKMCLLGGQPAAIWSNNQIQAVFACGPKSTLANFAGEKVEVQGYWAGDGKSVKTLVPLKIRQGSGEWGDVVCQEMHM